MLRVASDYKLRYVQKKDKKKRDLEAGLLKFASDSAPYLLCDLGQVS